MTSSLVSPDALAGDAANLPGPSLHERLRRATAAYHRALDRGLRYVLGPDLTPERYVRLLVALYGFYVPLEASLSRLQTAPAPLTMPLVQRAKLLEGDLRALGADPARAALCDQPLRLASVAHLSGAFYVVEGACLGGQVIARAVTRQLDLRHGDGAAFFLGDSARTGLRWKAVLAWLETRGRATGARHEIIEGACHTFIALRRWLSGEGVLDE